MKKLLKLMLIVMISTICINVNAEDTWPKEYTTENGFTYEIKELYLNLYPVTYQENQNNGDSLDKTITTESLTNYINPTTDPIKIPLDATTVTINPTHKSDKLGEYNTTFINLGLNLSKSQIKTIIENKLDDTTLNLFANEIDRYLVDLVVKYQLTDYPDKAQYRFFDNINVYKYSLQGLISGTTQIDTAVNIENDINQVLNIALVSKNSNEIEVEYETEVTEDNGLLLNVLNYLVLSKTDPKNLSVYGDTTEEDYSNSRLLMFHSITNIDYVIDSFKEKPNQAEPSASATGDNTVKDQEVKVPNTAKSNSIVLLMVSIVIILSGFTIITYTIKMKQFKKSNE